MNTFLSLSQEAQLEQYRAFALNEIAPVAAALTSHEACMKQFLQNLAQKGYLGITVPKEYGGQGGTLLDMVMFVEAVSEHEPGLALSIGNHVAVIEVLKKYASDELKSRYLPLLGRGECFAALAFSESQAGTDFEAVSSVVFAKDGQHTFSGQKSWVVSGDFADLFLLLGKKDGGQDGDHVLQVVLLDRPSEAHFKLLNERRLMGLRSAYVNDIEFDNAKVQPDRLIGDGLRLRAGDIVLYAMDIAKVILSAGAVGLLTGSTKASVQHARERKQFGATIGQYQGVQWKLADMGVDNAAARLLTYRAAWSHDGDPELFPTHAAMCKFFAARSARTHSAEAVQIMGAAGLTYDAVVARYYADAKVMEVAQGTSEFQKMLMVKQMNIYP